MTRFAKILITGTALTILPLTIAYADGSTDNGSSAGSQILNGQVNFNATVSTLNTQAYHVGQDVVGQSVAGGNAVDITTMNDTVVINNQFNKSTTIDSTINAGVGHVGGSVGYTSQAACNSAGISTDPTLTAIDSTQECQSIDPSSKINATISNIGGDVGLASSAVGNTFEADSNAMNMPVLTKQINSSFVHSTINSDVSNVAGTFSSSSAAVGNNAQIIHYSTGN